MSQYIIYTFDENSTTIKNRGTGGATYNGTAARNQYAKDSAGYPIWGSLDGRYDLIAVPGGISNAYHHTWQIGLKIHQWWPVAGIDSYGYLNGNDGKLWSAANDLYYGYLHQECNYSGGVLTQTGVYHFSIEVQQASYLNCDFWLGVENNKPVQITGTKGGEVNSSLYIDFNYPLKLNTNYYFQIAVDAGGPAANDYTIGNCAGAGCSDPLSGHGFPCGCYLYSWREDNTTLGLSGGGNWADDVPRWSGQGTPGGGGGGGTTPTTYGGSTPAACSWPDGTYIVFVRGKDGKVYYRKYSGSAWGNWTSIGGTLSLGAGPGVASRGQNKIDVFTAGTNNVVYYTYTNDGKNFSTWENIGGLTTSSCGAAVATGDKVNVFARGTDGRCYWAQIGSNFKTQWVSIGGQLLEGTGPAACSRGSKIDVLATGTNGKIYHNNNYSGSWSGWTSIGGSTDATPGIATSADNTLVAFARGTSGALYLNDYDGTWGGWQMIGGTLATGTGPGICVVGQEYEAFVTGINGSIYHVSSSDWLTWENLGGAATVSPVEPTPVTPPVKPPNPSTTFVGIWIGIGNAQSTNYTATVGTNVTVNGAAGYTDSNGHWIAGKPYTGELWEWMTPSSTGLPEDMGKISPDARGAFTFTITSTTTDTCSYNIGLVSSARVQGESQKVIKQGTTGKTTVTIPSTPCSVTVVTIDGDADCQNLMKMLNSAGIPFINQDTSVTGNNSGFNCFPGVILCSGSKIGGCTGNISATDTVGLFAAISNERSRLETNTISQTPSTPTIYQDVFNTLMPTQWANRAVIVTWQAAGATTVHGGTSATQLTAIPTTSTTTVGQTKSLTPVLPVPPTIAQGITVVLRDHKSAPSPR